MANLVDLSALDATAMLKITRSNLLPKEVALLLLQRKKLDFGAVERKDELLELFSPEWRQYVVKQYVNMPFLDKDAFLYLFSFFENEALDVLALVCKDMKDIAETFAEKAIKSFKNTNRVDSTWRARLRQYTERHGLVTHRKELQLVTQVYMRREEVSDCVDIVKLPRESEVLIQGIDGFIRVWNLETKRVVRSFHEEPDAHSEDINRAILLSQDFVVAVAQSTRHVKVWTMEGEFVHRIQKQDSPHVYTTVGNKLFYMNMNAERHREKFYLEEMDLSSGQITQHTSQVWTQMFFCSLLSVGSWLLVLCLDDANVQDANKKQGIFVLNSTDMTMEPNHYTGAYWTMSSFGNKIAAIHANGQIEILNLNGGSLERLHSIQYPSAFAPYSVMFDGSRIYVSPSAFPPRPLQPSDALPQRLALIHGMDISPLGNPRLVWEAEASSSLRCCTPVQATMDGDEILLSFCTIAAEPGFPNFSNERYACMVLVFPKP